MKLSPCKNCKDRELGCHDKCEKYIKWKSERQEILDKKIAEFELNAVLNSTKIKTANRKTK